MFETKFECIHYISQLQNFVQQYCQVYKSKCQQVLRIPFFCVMMLCHRVIRHSCFEGTHCPHLQRSTGHRRILCSSTTYWPLNMIAVDCIWNVMAHVQKPDFVFWRNGRAHLIRQGRQFSPLLAAEVCASAVAMLDTPCSEVVWRVLASHSIRQFPFHYPSHMSPCAITFQLDSTFL